MTLSRQLMLSGLIILLCLFTGMITFVVKNTQTFLSRQLASHSQDTATALGITLTTIMKNNDIETASRTVDAVWDRGYYKSITIESENGSPLIERQSEIKVYGVPEWFIQHFPLKTEHKEALIMDGWRKVGKVDVASNPGFGYKQIWSTFIESSEWFLITALIAVILGAALLHIILRPLRAITAQAMAICNQQFPQQEKLPWTIDLRLVVEAMNTMSGRLKQLFFEQTSISEQLREQAFKDPVTKLGNRRYFDLQFDHILKDQEKGVSGALLFIEIKDFKEYNDQFGYLEGDSLLKNVARTLEFCSQAIEMALIAHAKGVNLAIVLPNASKETAIAVATHICQEFNDFKNKDLSKRFEIGNLGIALFGFGDNKKDIVSNADMALRKAQNQGTNQWAISENIRSEETFGIKEWETIFAECLQKEKIVLHFQEVKLLKNQQPKMFETLLRLNLGQNKIINAGIFMPMAERLNQIKAMDELVITHVVNKIIQSKENYQYSVNLSPSFLVDEPFKKWLLNKLKSLGKQAQQLVIELPEFGVVNRIKETREFFLKISALGGKTSIDHYGKNFNSFSYLYNLKLNYLKIDGSFIRKINESEENKFFVRSLVEIAHSLGIQVIAESVENQEEYLCLEQLKVDGLQGYFIATPKEYVE